jgi:hypothetical protein
MGGLRRTPIQRNVLWKEDGSEEVQEGGMGNICTIVR